MKAISYSSTCHPDDATLDAYQQTPDAQQFRDVSMHLLNCVQCRHQLDMQMRLVTASAFLSNEPVTEAQQQNVDDFVYAGDHAQMKNERQAIKQHSGMLKSALHSLVQSPQQLSLQIQESAVTRPVISTQKRGWLETGWQYLQHKFSGWMTIPATALATLLLVAMVLQVIPPASVPVQLIAYQDDPAIHFLPVETMPGIGFFSAANQRTENFSGMQTTVADKTTLNFNWPDIDGAKHYRLTLYDFQQGKKTLLKNLDSNTTSASINLDAGSSGQRYEWILSGKTTANERFVSSGGFVMR